MAIEASRIALKYMTPVMYLSDAFVGNGAEPWRVPGVAELPDISVPNAHKDDGPFLPYARDPVTLSRPWAVPGTAGLEHRIGGLEKLDGLGTVSYDADNHHRMVAYRHDKVAGIVRDVPDLEVFGPETGDLLLVGWGSTYGALRSAAERLQADGRSVAHAQIRYLYPFPANTGDVLRRYRTVLVPELNLGQLAFVLRGTYLVDAISYGRVRGKPFRIAEIVDEANRILARGE
jgi:2-oxoglutarate ferredoxin oxidoreductase subunit alpha